MKERIDISSDISILIAQLKRLAASRLGRRLEIGELVLVDPKLAQIIIDLDAAVETWGEQAAREEGLDPKELLEDWRALRRRIIRKAALSELRKLSENTRIFVAASEEEERDRKWGYSGEDEELA